MKNKHQELDYELERYEIALSNTKELPSGDVKADRIRRLAKIKIDLIYIEGNADRGYDVSRLLATVRQKIDVLFKDLAHEA